MRISAKAEYAVRALAQLAADGADGPVKAEHVATEQEIPLKFLLGILRELRQARLVRSTRGPEGGYELYRPATEITLADVIRAVDGPLASVRDLSLSDLTYPGPLAEVWMAVRGSLRSVLEAITLADLVEDKLPKHVRKLAADYRADNRYAR
jgi:Rrf2 family protein